MAGTGCGVVVLHEVVAHGVMFEVDMQLVRAGEEDILAVAVRMEGDMAEKIDAAECHHTHTPVEVATWRTRVGSRSLVAP